MKLGKTVGNCGVVIVGISLAWAITGGAAQAGLVTDDFNYANYTTAYFLKNGPSGGTGWDGNWGATTGTSSGALHTVNPGTSVTLANGYSVGKNLTYQAGGYNVAQTGEGMVTTAQPAIGEYRGVNRFVDEDLTGTVWFSFLMANSSATNCSNGLLLNAHADMPYAGNDYLNGSWGVGINGETLFLRYDGVNYSDSDSIPALEVGKTHLILGKITIGPGNDTISIWADPADLANLGDPLLTQTGADMGDAIYLIGLGGTNSTGSIAAPASAYDAIRFSDTSTAFADVTGWSPAAVPEPGTGALLAGALVGLAALTWRRKK